MQEIRGKLEKILKNSSEFQRFLKNLIEFEKVRENPEDYARIQKKCKTIGEDMRIRKNPRNTDKSKRKRIR